MGIRTTLQVVVLDVCLPEREEKKSLQSTSSPKEAADTTHDTIGRPKCI